MFTVIRARSYSDRVRPEVAWFHPLLVELQSHLAPSTIIIMIVLQKSVLSKYDDIDILTGDVKKESTPLFRLGKTGLCDEMNIVEAIHDEHAASSLKLIFFNLFFDDNDQTDWIMHGKIPVH